MPHYTDAHNRERKRQQVIADIRAERNRPPPEPPKNFAEALGSFLSGILILSLPGYLIGSVLFGGHAEPIYPYGDGRMIQEFVYSDFGGFLGIMTAVVVSYLIWRDDLTKQY